MERQRYLLFASLAAVVVTTLLVLVVQVFGRPYSFHGSLIEPPLEAADFLLDDQHGRSFRLAEQQGSVVLMFFGYTHCPDVCPATMATFRSMRSQLGDRADEVEFVFVTVDPRRDSQERIAAYLGKVDPRITGLTGDERALGRVWEDYFVFRSGGETELEHSQMQSDNEQTHPADGDEEYLVEHTSRVYVIDRSGDLRLTFPFGMTADAMLADVLHLLDES